MLLSSLTEEYLTFAYLACSGLWSSKFVEGAYSAGAQLLLYLFWSFRGGIVLHFLLCLPAYDTNLLCLYLCNSISHLHY